MDKPTRNQNILDLILTNNSELFYNCEVEINSKFSDHNLVKVGINIDLSNDSTHTDNLRYPNDIPLFNWRKGSSEDWEKYKSYLDSKDWSLETQGMHLDLKIETYYQMMIDAVTLTFSKKELGGKKRIIP